MLVVLVALVDVVLVSDVLVVRELVDDTLVDLGVIAWGLEESCLLSKAVPTWPSSGGRRRAGEGRSAAGRRHGAS